MLALGVLLLAGAGSGAPVEEQHVICETGGPKNDTKTECYLPQGKPVKIVAHGDLDEGCKFIHTNKERTCCYMDRVRNFKKDTELCDRFQQASGCRGEADFIVTEKKLNWDHGACNLHIQSFRSEDLEMYKAVFPNDKKTNKIIEVKEVMNESIIIIAVVVPVLIVLAFFLAAFLIHKNQVLDKIRKWKRSWGSNDDDLELKLKEAEERGKREEGEKNKSELEELKQKLLDNVDEDNVKSENTKLRMQLIEQEQRHTEEIKNYKNADMVPLGWKNKSRPLVLSFENKSSTPVNICSWVYITRKPLVSVTESPFTGFHGKVYLCESKGTVMHGVSGSFKVQVGGEAKFVYFSQPYFGCARIQSADTPEEAQNQAVDGSSKEYVVANLNMYMTKEVAPGDNSSAEGFSVVFKLKD